MADADRQSFAVRWGGLAVDRIRTGAYNNALTPAIFDIATRWSVRNDSARQAYLNTGLAKGQGNGEDFLAYVSSRDLEIAEHSDDDNVRLWAIAAVFAVGLAGGDHALGMSTTGQVQEGGGGTTYVAYPASADTYKGAGRSSPIYAEFDVPSSVLKAGGGNPNYRQIPGPRSNYAKDHPEEPIMWPVPACNIERLC
jgi:hypothetical protein